MTELNDLKKDIAEMAQMAADMWKMTHQAFMEHDVDLFAPILEKESLLNELEKQLTAELVEIGKAASTKEEQEIVLGYADIVGDIELIGDYCKDILERVQIKIEEKLLFSDDAVKEYGELYQKTAAALEEVAQALEKDEPCFVRRLLGQKEQIGSLVDEYRRRHNQRLIDGVCSPFACNMFLNMLDFTAAVYYHTNKIADTLAKIKK